MSISELENLTHLSGFPKDWEVLPIESLCLKVTSGGTPSRKNPAFYKNGSILWIKTQELKDWYIEDSQEKITEEALKKSSAKLLPVNTVLMAMYGDGRTITSLGILRKEAATNQACCALVPNLNICEPLYLFYLLKFHKNHLIKLALGGAQRNLSGTIIRTFKVKVPSLPIQRKIAAILSAYDRLIENNTRRIEILEEMARSLYREWFVKFRFPSPEQVQMVNSELGLIPEGWEVGRLDDALLLQRGFDLPTQQRKEGNIPIYASTGVTGAHNEAKVKAPGVVTGRSGSLGTVIYIDEDFWPLNTTLWVKEFRRVTPLYAFYLLSDLKLEQYNSGAAVPTLNRNDIHGRQVVIPPPKTLEHLNVFVEPLLVLKKNLLKRSDNLRQTRDLLLPRLISGEINLEKIDIGVYNAENN
jgi:type I restriction enzyme S subunit